MTATMKTLCAWLSAALALSLTMILALAAGSASARPWKPDPKASAQDYSQIVHSKSNGDIVLLWWLVPQIVPTVPQAQDVLDKYVIIGIVEGHVSPVGSVSFIPIDTLTANDSSGKPLRHLTPNDVPPALTGLLAGLQAALAQSIGAMGQGMHWFVFDGGGIHACGSGGLAIPYQGETYTYETPIPGCPKV